MLTESQIQQFKRDGFLRGGRVITDAQVDVLRAELDRVIANRNEPVKQPVMLHNFTGDEKAPVWQIVNIYDVSEPFRELIFNQRVCAETAQLAETDELRMWHDQIQYKPARDGGVNGWHQDSPLWPTLKPMDMVTAWVALDDVDESNGCMSMVPGSHLWGDNIKYLASIAELGFHGIPSTFAGHDVKPRLCPVAKGEVHFHHSLTWHGSFKNVSDRPRRAIALHYMKAGTRFDASGEHPMKPFIEVADGEILRGKHFPTTWTAKAALAAQT
jgi:phytanoyl-CoA hydroxylase